MAGRKIGVGFNQPRVLGGRMRHDREGFWRMMRALTRLRREKRFGWQRPVAHSVIETARRFRADA